MKFERKHASLALLSGAMLLCASAWASPPMGKDVVTRTITVKYLATEAATAEGAEKLYRKLRRAAGRACSDSSSGAASRFFDLGPDYASCVEAALGKAVQDVAIPMVSSLHGAGVKAPTVAAR